MGAIWYKLCISICIYIFFCAWSLTRLTKCGQGEARPSKCLNHHNPRLCKIFVAGVNLLLQTYGVCPKFIFGWIFTPSLSKKSRKRRAKCIFLSFNSVFTRYLKSTLFKLCNLGYNLEIMAICCNFNFAKTWGKFFSHGIMVV